MVFLVGGLLLVLVPQAVFDIVTGDDAVDRTGAAVRLSFFAWLTWRNVLLFRSPEVARTHAFWMATAAGFAVFAALAGAFFAWSLTTEKQDAQDMVQMTLTLSLLLGLFVSALSAGRRHGKLERP